MRQRVAYAIHDLNSPLRIRDADMDVETESKQRARDHLILFNDQLISCILENLLILPMRERMCASSDNLQALLAHKGREDAAKICDIRASFLYIFADSRADLDHGLDHFWFDLLAEQHLAFFKNL